MARVRFSRAASCSGGSPPRSRRVRASSAARISSAFLVRSAMVGITSRDLSQRLNLTTSSATMRSARAASPRRFWRLVSTTRLRSSMS